MNYLSKQAQAYIVKLQKEGKLWYEDKDSKFVLLFEKPSQVKAIKPVFGSSSETQHLKNVALAGHTLRLKNFEEYNPALKDKSWYKMVKDKDLPFIPDQYEMVVKEKSTGKFRTDYEEMVNSAKRAFQQADWIVLCTDPDAEGCALGMEVIMAANATDKVIGMVNMSKLDFFSLQEEVKHLDKIPFHTMAQSGFARGEFDWAFGLNNTILASVLLGGGQTYHIGGVKSPVIRMVVDRMNDIAKFKPVKYWRFHGSAKHLPTGEEFSYIIKVKQNDTELKAAQEIVNKLELEVESIDKENPENADTVKKLYDELGKSRWKLSELTKQFESAERDIYSKAMKKKVEEKIKSGLIAKVTNFSTKNNLTQNPPLAYSLTDLQAEAGALYNFTPAKTLEIAQKLYEAQVQSYPRTDNRYYASGEMANIKKIVPNLLGLSKFANVNIPTPYKAKTGIFNSAKVTAHTGLAPTTKEVKDSTLSGDQKTIYEMVATRYLIQFMDKFEYYKVEMDADIDAEIYITTFQNIQTKKGWRELYNPANMYGFTYTEKQTMPNMTVGDEIEIISIETESLETKPLPMFSEFSLLKAMENISRIYPELQGLEKGIGTPATRASILDQLFKAKYLIKKGKQIVASDKAKRLIELLPDDMTNPKLRADMEAKLNEIVAGNLTKADYEVTIKELVTLQAEQLYKVASKHKIETIDKATLPPSPEQIKFAKTVEKELGVKIPAEAFELKDEMTKWLKKHEKNMPIMLSEKQVAFIETYCEDQEILEILKKNAEKTMTKEEKFKAGKWLGSYLRTSEYHKKRAAKAKATKAKNLEDKMKKFGVKKKKED